MKQVLRQGLEKIVVEHVPDPMIRAHHVLVSTRTSLISSGTETASIRGVMKAVADNPSQIGKILNVMKENRPLATTREILAKFDELAVLGYSGAGVVCECHSTVTDIQVGDRVAYGGEGTGHAETILAGQNLVAKIPEGVSFEEACFTTVGAIALNSIRTANVGIGEVVAVIGVGLVGQLVAQLARLQGATVIAIDLRNDRLELAARHGADHALKGDGYLQDHVSALTNGLGADCVVIAAAAKSATPAHQALQICRDRGRIVVVGAVSLDLPWHEMYMKEIQLYMSRAYGPGSYDSEYEKGGRDYPITYVRWTERRNMEEVLRLMAAGRLQVKALITHEFELDDAAAAYRTIMDSSANSLAVILKYPAAKVQSATELREQTHRVEVAPKVNKGAVELRAALIGAGNLARWAHLPALRKADGTTLQAVYSSSGARGKTYARRFSATYCTSDLEEILSDKSVDFCLILTRNQDHARQSVAALRAGKHVFVEKPMALTEEECREIVSAVAESGRYLTVGFNRRFAPFYIQLKKALKSRTGPAILNCRINSPGITGDYWMADPAIGGAIMGEACHFVDLMYWLVDAEPVSVMAYSLPESQKAPIGTNNVVASFKFADGSIGSLTYCTAGSRTSGGERVEVFAQGVAAMTENFKRLKVMGGSVTSYSKWWAEKGYDSQMAAFVRAIDEKKPPMVTEIDGVRATIGSLRMLESARTGRPCNIDLQSFCR